MKYEQLEEKAREAIRHLVEGVPFVQVVSAPLREDRAGHNDQVRPDFAFDVMHRKLRRRMIAECISNGEPRSVRAAVHQLLAHRHEGDGLVVIAPYLSPEAAAICEASGVNYVDLSGNGRLALENPDLFISKQNFTNTLPQRRSQKSLYTPKAERILRVLLTKPQERWTLTRLAQEAHVSIGQVHKVKDLLADREWIETNGGLRLSRPGQLLDEWAAQTRISRNKAEEFYTMEPLAFWEERLARVCEKNGVRYAVTGLSAAARYAFYAQYQRVSVFIEGDVDGMMDDLSIKRVSTGANITVLTPYDAGVFYEAQTHGDAAIVACPVQVYLDLASSRGRSLEAAAHLRTEVIESQWRTK